MAAHYDYQDEMEKECKYVSFDSFLVPRSELKNRMITAMHYMQHDLSYVCKWLNDIRYNTTKPEFIEKVVEDHADFMLDVEDTAKLYDFLRYDMKILERKELCKPNIAEMLNDFYCEDIAVNYNMTSSSVSVGGQVFHLPGPRDTEVYSKKIKMKPIPICMVKGNILTYFGNSFYMYMPDHGILIRFNVAFDFAFDIGNKRDTNQWNDFNPSMAMNDFEEKVVYSFYIGTVSFYLKHEDDESIILQGYPDDAYKAAVEFEFHTKGNKDWTCMRITNNNNLIRQAFLRSNNGRRHEISLGLNHRGSI